MSDIIVFSKKVKSADYKGYDYVPISCYKCYSGNKQGPTIIKIDLWLLLIESNALLDQIAKITPLRAHLYLSNHLKYMFTYQTNTQKNMFKLTNIYDIYCVGC